jgi:ATP-dependent protease ClpP protease subunit
MIPVAIKGVITSDDDAEVYQWLGYSTVTPTDVSKALDAAGGQDVTLQINSPGGDVFAGSEMATAIKSYNGNVTANIVGLAASAASIVALAAGNVQMAPTAQLMIHRAATSADGNVDALNSASQSLDSIDQSLVDVYTAKTGMSASDVYDLMVKETWLNAKQAVDKGFADGIMFDKAPAVTNSTLTLTSDVVERIKTLMAKTKENKTEPTPSQPKADDTKAIDPKLALLLGLNGKDDQLDAQH